MNNQMKYMGSKELSLWQKNLIKYDYKERNVIIVWKYEWSV